MKKPAAAHKTMAEKLQETVHILRKLKETGVVETEPGYILTKKVLEEWMRGEDSRHEIIEFPRYERRLELILPVRQDRQPTAVFRVVR
jgi:hypothetical protein